jgi:excisionase family DNA binding protein
MQNRKPTFNHTLSRLAYRPKEAARLLGVSPATFWRRVADKEIKTHRKHGVTLVTAEELVRWISETP